MDIITKDGYRISGRTCFSLTYHLVFVTKYRHPVIRGGLKDDLYHLLNETMTAKGCRILEMNGEADHVHILFEATPFVSLAELINVLKTRTSRQIRKKYGDTVLKDYYQKPHFWSYSSFIGSANEQSQMMVEQYIKAQSGD